MDDGQKRWKETRYKVLFSLASCMNPPIKSKKFKMYVVQYNMCFKIWTCHNTSKVRAESK